MHGGSSSVLCVSSYTLCHPAFCAQFSESVCTCMDGALRIRLDIRRLVLCVSVCVGVGGCMERFLDFKAWSRVM